MQASEHIATSYAELRDASSNAKVCHKNRVADQLHLNVVLKISSSLFY